MTSQTVQAVLLVLCAATMKAAYALPLKLNVGTLLAMLNDEPGTP